MNEERIRTLLFENLKDKDAAHAATETCRQMGEELLADIYQSRTVDEPTWAMLLKINAALARLNLFAGAIHIYPDTTLIFSPKYFTDISFLYDMWEEITSYLATNFNKLASENFKVTYRVEELQLIATKVGMLKMQAGQEIAGTSSVTVYTRELSLMGATFRWGWRAVMGDDLYEKIIEAFNRQIPIIAMYYLQITNPSHGKVPS